MPAVIVSFGFRRINRRPRRRWLYPNLTAWLTQTFATIARESPFGVKQMLEDRQPEAESKYALEAARRYHQWTAVSELMSYLEQAAAKNGCTRCRVRQR